MSKGNKYYAIKEGRGVKNTIVTTWSECEKLVMGYQSVYKSFKTEAEAVKYLETVDVNKVKYMAKQAMELKRNGMHTHNVLTIELDDENMRKYSDKCRQMEISEEAILKNMILEWVN